MVGADEVDGRIGFDLIFHPETPEVCVEEHAAKAVVDDVLGCAVGRREHARSWVVRVVVTNPRDGVALLLAFLCAWWGVACHAIEHLSACECDAVFGVANVTTAHCVGVLDAS